MNSPDCKTSTSYSSSKNCIEKYYRTFPEITILSSSSHDSTKGDIFEINSNNFQLEKKECSPNKKNELLKKFQNFLEHLHLEEGETGDEKEVTKNLSFLLDLEPEEMGKKLKMIRDKTLKSNYSLLILFLLTINKTKIKKWEKNNNHYYEKNL